MQCNVAYYDNRNGSNSNSNNYNHSYSNVNNGVDPSYPQQLGRLPTAHGYVLQVGFGLCAVNAAASYLHICLAAATATAAGGVAATSKSHYLVDTPTKNGQQPENVAMLPGLLPQCQRRNMC